MELYIFVVLYVPQGKALAHSGYEANLEKQFGFETCQQLVWKYSIYFSYNYKDKFYNFNRSAMKVL